MSKRQLILHIGMPKTGSTSIQDFFKANAGPLEEKGYVYLPKRGRVWPRLMDKSVNFRDKISFDEQWAPVREALLKDNKSVIFSDEGLLHAFTQDWTRLEKIQSYVDGVEVVVVLYLRRQDLHMESAYKEGLKQFDLPVPFSPDIIRDIWGEKYHHYYDHVCRLVDLVGKENLRLQVYERERFPERNVVLDFCTLVGIELDASFVFPERVSNPSIDARLLDYYGVFNSQWEVHDSAGQVFNELLTLAGNEIFEKNDGRILSPLSGRRCWNNTRIPTAKSPRPFGEPASCFLLRPVRKCRTSSP